MIASRYKKYGDVKMTNWNIQQRILMTGRLGGLSHSGLLLLLLLPVPVRNLLLLQPTFFLLLGR